MFCLHCSYALDGLAESRCPECGRPFAPDDPTTFATRPKTRKDLILDVLRSTFPDNGKARRRVAWREIALIVVLLALLAYFTSIGWIASNAAR